MSLVIRDLSTVPAERWHFPIPNLRTVDAPNFHALLDAIATCCTTNGVPVPSNQDVIDYLCANTHIPCYDSETRVPLVNMFSQNIPVPQRGCCSKTA